MNVKLNPAQPKAKAEDNTIKVADAIPGLTTEQDTIVAMQGETQPTSDGGGQGEPPVVQETPPVVAPEAEIDLGDDELLPFEKNPSDWAIEETLEGIRAYNRNSARVFEGDMAYFNLLLKN